MEADRRFNGEVLTRRNLLSAVPALATAKASPDVDARIIEFHNHWAKFLRAYLGCPPHAKDVAECNEHLGIWDYAEFLKAAKVGRELFTLDEKK